MTGRVLDFYLPFRTGRVALCNARHNPTELPPALRLVPVRAPQKLESVRGEILRNRLALAESGRPMRMHV
ncbi:uncharacterized protein PHALS_08734 [Plasmopara halstedii]|uniref:Uncharacterized protein n=1 Tax=Plasmopara halstedii TaxID=4781 RepID=A0A0P1AD97_PLAHL|nr:uncharacterized protein PHALS_08734 [Plasmopara halstedii]CEG38674.1 hypothetical protein PHALS_08734 [Plasmopara halstedii]|eukprot:XP_024575043.1 hypothetical protein PHALS_08734 [Plasmopara halstedii]